MFKSNLFYYDIVHVVQYKKNNKKKVTYTCTFARHCLFCVNIFPLSM